MAFLGLVMPYVCHPREILPPDPWWQVQGTENHRMTFVCLRHAPCVNVGNKTSAHCNVPFSFLWAELVLLLIPVPTINTISRHTF
jgi:hypothetical protein